MEMLIVLPYFAELLYLSFLLAGLFLVWYKSSFEKSGKLVWTILIVLFNVLAFIPLIYLLFRKKKEYSES